MCGIAGLVTSTACSPEQLYKTCRVMAQTLAHRGPDDQGVWVDPDLGVALGHRRLSILDLSVEGRQPMVSANGTNVITFNGEIYNYEALRKELEAEGQALKFRSRSDTEVMLEALGAWGVKKAVGKFIGMFSFAFWDRGGSVLYLVRDRIGIKPLYYGWAGNTLVFGSELKTVAVHPDFRKEVNRDALGFYLRHSYIPAPYSIYRDAFKLLPGHFMAIFVTKSMGKATTRLNPEPYWSLRDVWRKGAGNPFEGTDEELTEELHSLLEDAVRLRMISDVPLGAFLSGGIDSSTVVALMQSHRSLPVKTFSIGFHEQAFNEACYAKEVARHLGTDHTELYLTDRQAMHILPDLPSVYDEPLADASQIPTYAVSRLAREHVTVSLSGDGGDELFAGYDKYDLALRYWEILSRIPKVVRLRLLPLLRRIPENVLDILSKPLIPAIVALGYRPGPLGNRLHRFALRAGQPSFPQLYRSIVSEVSPLDGYVPGARDIETIFSECVDSDGSMGPVPSMCLVDLLSYLPDDILAKVDRASMAVGLEARVPLLDHRIVEFSARIPPRLKLEAGIGKRILRKVLHRYVPERLTDRPKTGFTPPIGRWLSGGLRDWAEELLSVQRLKQQDCLATEPVRRIWHEHLINRPGRARLVWAILMFQAWLQQNHTAPRIH